MQIAQANEQQIWINDFSQEQTVWHVQAHASLFCLDICLGHSQVKSGLEVILAGEGASVEIIGLFFGDGSQSFDIAHVVRHKASHTTSSLLTKGALTDRAKATYRGLIEIPNGSVGCRGEESEHTLLLSDKARIETVPALEIGNDDVKATHSVSTTYIDDLKKFYLESRGLSEEEAVRQIVQGHFADILMKISDEKIRSEIECAIVEKLHKCLISHIS